MKRLLVLVVFLGSALAQGNDVVNYNSDEHMCSELQGILKENSQISINGPFGSDFYYLTPYQCPPLHRPNISYVTSKDLFFCQLGYTCFLKP